MTNNTIFYRSFLSARNAAALYNVTKTLHRNTFWNSGRSMSSYKHDKRKKLNKSLLLTHRRLPAEEMLDSNYYEAIGRAILTKSSTTRSRIFKKLGTNPAVVEKLLMSTGFRGNVLGLFADTLAKAKRSRTLGNSILLSRVMIYIGKSVIAGSLNSHVGGPVTPQGERFYKNHYRYRNYSEGQMPKALLKSATSENIKKVARSILWNPLKEGFLFGSFKACHLLRVAMLDGLSRNRAIKRRGLINAYETDAFVAANKSYSLVTTTARIRASSRPLFLNSVTNEVEFVRNRDSWYWKRFLGPSFIDYTTFFNSVEYWPSYMYTSILRRLYLEAYHLRHLIPGMGQKAKLFMAALRREEAYVKRVDAITDGFYEESFGAKPTMASASRAKKRRYRRGVTTVVALWRYVDLYGVSDTFEKILDMALQAPYKWRRKSRSVVRRFDYRKATMGAIRLLREHGFTLREVFCYMTSLDRPITPGLLTGLISKSTKHNVRIGLREDERAYKRWAATRAQYMDKNWDKPEPWEFIGPEFDQFFARKWNPGLFLKCGEKTWIRKNNLITSNAAAKNVPRGYPRWPNVKGVNVEDLRFYIRVCPHLMRPEWMKVLNELVRRKKNPLPPEYINGKRVRRAPKPPRPKLFPGKRTLVGTGAPEWQKPNWPASYVSKYKLILPEELPVIQDENYVKGSTLPVRTTGGWIYSKRPMLGLGLDSKDPSKKRNFSTFSRFFDLSAIFNRKKKQGVYESDEKSNPPAAASAGSLNGPESSTSSTEEESSTMTDYESLTPEEKRQWDKEMNEIFEELEREYDPKRSSNTWSPGRFINLRAAAWKRRGRYIAESRKKYPRGFKWPAAEADMEPILFNAKLRGFRGGASRVIRKQNLLVSRVNRKLKKNINKVFKKNLKKKVNAAAPKPRRRWWRKKKKIPFGAKAAAKSANAAPARAGSFGLKNVNKFSGTPGGRVNVFSAPIKRNFSTISRAATSSRSPKSPKVVKPAKKFHVPTKPKSGRRPRFYRPKLVNRSNVFFKAGNVRKPLPKGVAPQRFSIRQKQRRFNQSKRPVFAPRHVWVGGMRKVWLPSKFDLAAFRKHPRVYGPDMLLRNAIKTVFYHKKKFDWNGKWRATRHGLLLSSKSASVVRLGFRRSRYRGSKFLKRRIVLIKKSEKNFIEQWRWFAKAGLIPADANLRDWKHPNDYRSIKYEFFTTQSFVIRQLKWVLFWDDLLGLIRLRNRAKKFSRDPQVFNNWNDGKKINYGGLGVLFDCKKVLYFLAESQAYLNSVIKFNLPAGTARAVSFEKKIEIVNNIRALALFYLGSKQTSNLLELIKVLDTERIEKNLDVADSHSEIGFYLVFWATNSENNPSALAPKTKVDGLILSILSNLNKINFWNQPREKMLLFVLRKLPLWLALSSLSRAVKAVIVFRFKLFFRRTYNKVSQFRRFHKKNIRKKYLSRSPSFYKILASRARSSRARMLLASRKKGARKYAAALTYAYAAKGLSEFTSKIGELAGAFRRRASFAAKSVSPVFTAFGGGSGTRSLFLSREAFSTFNFFSRRLFRRRVTILDSKRYLPLINNVRPTFVDYERPYFSVGSTRRAIVVSNKYQIAVRDLTEFDERGNLLISIRGGSLIKFMAFAAISLSSDVNN